VYYSRLIYYACFRSRRGDSLLQWLVIPTIAALRRPGDNVRLCFKTCRRRRLHRGLQINDSIWAGSEGRLSEGLKTKPVCRVRQIIVVPDRIGSRRGMLTLGQALLGCPHASLIGESTLQHSLGDIARSLGGTLNQSSCAILCRSAWRLCRQDVSRPCCHYGRGTQTRLGVCDLRGSMLGKLDRELALVWNPRLMKIVALPLGRPQRTSPIELRKNGAAQQTRIRIEIFTCFHTLESV